MIVRNVLSNYVALGIQMGVRIIQLGMFARAMGSEGLGLFTLCLAVPTITQIAGYSLSKGTVRYMTLGLAKQDTQMQRRYFAASFWGFLILGVIGCVGIVGIHPFLPDFLQVPPNLISDAKQSFLIVAVGVLLTVPLNGYQGACQAAQRYDLLSAARSIVLLIQLGVYWLLYHYGWLNVQWALVVLFACRFAEAISWRLIARRSYPAESVSVGRMERAPIQSLLAFSMVAVAIDISNIVGNEGFKFLLGNRLDITMVGAYGVFAILASSVANLSWTASTVVAPVAGKSYAEGDSARLEKLFHLSTKSVTAMGIGTTVVLLPILPWLLSIWTQKEIAAYWPACAVLLGGQIGRLWAISGVNMLAGIGKQKLQAIITVVWVTGGMATSLLYFLFVGTSLLVGVSIMTAWRCAGSLALYYISARQFCQTSQIVAVWRIVLKPMIAGALAVSLGLWLLPQLEDLMASTWANLLTGGLVGIVCLVLMVLWVFSSAERAAILGRPVRKVSQRPVEGVATE